MIQWIVETSLKLRLAIAALAVFLIVFGFTELEQMPVDTLPEFARPYVEVQTEALGLSAEEVEALVTTPIEADLLNGVSWVEEIRSESIPGLSSIVLIFEKGTDIMRARQMVQERLIAVHALPNVSKPPTMLNPLSSTSRCMEIGLTSDKLSLIEMSVLARWTIVPRLSGVPGVANVSIWGYRDRQLQVQVDPEKLKAKGVSLMQVIRTAGNALWVSPLTFLEASTPGTGGWIDTPNQRLGVRHVLPISTPEDLEQIPIEGATSKRLGDVATLVEDHQPLIGDAVVNDAPALTLVVEKFPWANTMEVTEDVEAALAALRPGLAGLEMDPSLFRPATYLESAVDNLYTALMIGVGLAVVALFAFFANWRTALVSMVAVLVSVLAAGTVLYLHGVTINMVIITGVLAAIVALVDDAIADTDNVGRRLRKNREGSNGKSSASIILDAIVQMRSPLVFATVIMVLVVVPLLFLEGVSGAFWHPLATSYILALVCSFTVALTVTPVLSVLLLRNNPLPPADSPLAGMLRRMHTRLFGRLARSPRLALLAMGAVLIAGLACVPFLHEESIMPDLRETDLLIHWEGGSGASHPAMNRVTALASRELRALPGVLNVSAQVGRAIMSDKRSSINSGEIRVSVDPSADYEATVASVKQVVAGYPGLSPEVLTYLQAKIRDELSGTSQSLVVRVYGEEMSVIRKKAEEAQKLLARIAGIVDANVQYPEEGPTLEIEVDLEKAKTYGLKPGDVRRAATSLVSGILVGSLYEDQKVFDVVVYGSPETRHSVTGVQELLINTPDGGHVRLRDVADVRIAPSPTVINRDAVARRMDVTANVRGRDLAAVAADVQRSIQTINFPLEYRAELLGEYAERLAVQERMIAFCVAAAIAIFLLLQVFFRSWRFATAIFLSIPVTLAGCAVVTLLYDGVLSFGVIVGFIGVLGIAIRNTIMLVSNYRHQQREGEESEVEFVHRITIEQSAPILMTGIVSALVLLPSVFFGGIAGLEIAQPMASVVLGGLVTATFFALAGVPALYSLFGATYEPDLDLFSAKGSAVAKHSTEETVDNRKAVAQAAVRV